MKTIHNTTIYKCDHCGKIYQQLRFVPRHEETCKKNPDNRIACSGCVFMQEIEKSIDIDTYDGYRTIKRKAFFCKKKQIGLYPPKAIHSGVVGKYPEDFEEEERMPTECDLFSYQETFQ